MICPFGVNIVKNKIVNAVECGVEYLVGRYRRGNLGYRQDSTLFLCKNLKKSDDGKTATIYITELQLFQKKCKTNIHKLKIIKQKKL
jgi:hypothetical protein